MNHHFAIRHEKERDLPLRGPSNGRNQRRWGADRDEKTMRILRNRWILRMGQIIPVKRCAVGEVPGPKNRRGSRVGNNLVAPSQTGR